MICYGRFSHIDLLCANYYKSVLMRNILQYKASSFIATMFKRIGRKKHQDLACVPMKSQQMLYLFL